MKKLAMILIAGLAVAGVVYAQTTITNRGEVFEVTLMDDVEKSTETTTQPDEIVEDLTVEGALTLTSTNAAGVATATLTNAPAAGNPVKWAQVVVGGVTYVVPLFASE